MWSWWRIDRIDMIWLWLWYDEIDIDNDMIRCNDLIKYCTIYFDWIWLFIQTLDYRLRWWLDYDHDYGYDSDYDQTHDQTHD